MLPPSLSNLLDLPYPDDATLGQYKANFAKSTPGARMTSALQARAQRPLRALNVRFVNSDREDLPDSLTFGAFRALVLIGKASIIIEEGGGGLLVLS